MLFFTLAASTIYFTSILARGGRKGGGGGGTTIIAYTEDECHSDFLNPVYMRGNESGGYNFTGPKIGNYWYWIWNDQVSQTLRKYVLGLLT